ncbi:MAG TPA: methyltransferase, partial [Candidatus Obscuribacterales bacterium]
MSVQAVKDTSTNSVAPDKIMQLGLAFWGAKTLLSAVELGVFGALAKEPSSAERLTRTLGLHERGSRDFFDALVALGMLQRKNNLYYNSEEADFYLDPSKPSYIGGFLLMINSRLYESWGKLSHALKTGRPESEAKQSTEDLFSELYSDQEKLKLFLSAMTGISLANAREIAAKFPWSKYTTFCDVGTAQGALAVEVARAHEHLQGTGFDLPAVEPIFTDYVRQNGLSARVKFHAGDFFKHDLPNTDVLVMGHILHDWNLEQKRMLVAKAYKALNEGGALIVYDAMID